MRNLTRKLFLSICTLAICAVTLVSTTFAWYTQNTEVSASSVSGTSADTSSDGSLQISNELDGDYATTTTPKANTPSMLPIQYVDPAVDSDGDDLPLGYYLLEVGNSQVANTSYLTFKLYFKTDKSVSSGAAAVYLENITLSRTGDLVPFENYKHGEDYAPGAENYTVDIRRCLNLVTTTNSLTKHLDLAGLSEYNDTVENDDKDKISALSYYNNVMEVNPALTDSGDDGLALVRKNNEDSVDVEAIKIADFVDSNSDGKYDVVEVTFVVYLDGWDQYCFDACKGQTFGIALTFTSETGNALVGTEKTA